MKCVFTSAARQNVEQITSPDSYRGRNDKKRVAMRKTQKTADEARHMRFQIWGCPQEVTLRVPSRAIKRKPLSH